MAHSYNARSSFPASLDNFVIKQDAQPGLEDFQQPDNALIKADHFNHYFAACHNIQAYLLNNQNIGAPIYGTNAVGNVFGSEIFLGTTTVTASSAVSTGTISFLVTIPSAFGSTPFNDLGFSVGHSIYLKPVNQAASSIRPLWDNKAPGTDIYADLLSQTYAWGAVEPVSGRVFRYHIQLTNLLDNIRSALGRLIDRLANTASIRGDQVFHPNTVFGGYNPNTFLIGGGWLSILSSLRDYDGQNHPVWCYKAVAIQPVHDSSIALHRLLVWGSSNAAHIGSRGGLAVRMQGTPNNATFYALSLGDWTGAGNSTIARVLRVRNMNLNPVNGFSPSSTGWLPITAGAVSGTVTDLSGPLNLGNALSGNSNAGWLRLQVIGSTVSVASAITPSSTWVTVFSTVDPSPITGVGYPGVWSAHVTTSGFPGLGQWLEYGISARAATASALVAQANPSVGSAGVETEVRFIFCKIGPSGLVTLTNSGSA